MIVNEVLDFEKRCTHLDAQGFGFVGAGHGTSVIVGQDNDRPILQLRVEDPLAGNVKVVTVYQGKDGHILNLMDHIGDNTPDLKCHVQGVYFVHNLIHIPFPDGGEG